VVAHHLEEKVLDLLLARLTEMGLVGAGGKQRTDSTAVIAAVRDVNRLELAGESVRAVVEALSAAAPDWLAQVIDVPGWSRRYGRRIDSWKMPASKTRQDALALDYGRDGFALLSAVYTPGQPAWLRELPAVQVLRQVLLQNYTRTTARKGRVVIKRREKTDEGGDGLPPASIRLTSPYDTDARWAAKRDTFWNGYKVHISETCATQADDTARPASAVMSAPGAARPKPDGAPRRPNLITNIATTSSTLPDSKALEDIHRSQQHRGVLPDEHYLDSGYASAELITGSLARHGVALITPVLPAPPARPRPRRASPPTTSPSTGRPSRPPAPPGRPASPGIQSCKRACRRPWSPSPPSTASPAPTGSSARPPRATAANSPYIPKRWPKPYEPLAPSSRPRTGTPTTPNAPASKAPSGKQSPSPTCAKPATAAWQKPTSNTSTAPSH
jgi:hypothetical protein